MGARTTWLARLMGVGHHGTGFGVALAKVRLRECACSRLCYPAGVGRLNCEPGGCCPRVFVVLLMKGACEFILCGPEVRVPRSVRGAFGSPVVCLHGVCNSGQPLGFGFGMLVTAVWLKSCV